MGASIYIICVAKIRITPHLVVWRLFYEEKYSEKIFLIGWAAACSPCSGFLSRWPWNSWPLYATAAVVHNDGAQVG